jgi:hypothetical protein
MNVHDFSRGGIRAAPRSIALPSAVKHHARPARMCLARSSSPAVGQTDLKNVSVCNLHKHMHPLKLHTFFHPTCDLVNLSTLGVLVQSHNFYFYAGY